MDSIRDFFEKYKIPILVVMGLLVVVIVGYVLWALFYNPITIAFEGEDADVYVTVPTTISLGAKAYDKKKDDYEVKFKTDTGTLVSNEKNKISWELPTAEGVYTLSATAGNKTINKKVTVIGNVVSGSLTYNVPTVVSKDSDSDGLTDTYETSISNTDPNKIDSDEDGLYDGDEIELGLNPLEKDSKSDGKKDSERELKYVMEDAKSGVTVELLGTGNLTKTTVDKYTTETITKMAESASDLYYIYSDGVVKDTKIKIKYDKNHVASKGIAENNLCVYKLNESTGKFVKINTTVDTGAATVTASTAELGKVFLADQTKMKDSLSTELMFVIDNSGSMYSSEEIAESKGNDVDFKRVDLTNRLMDKLKGNYKFGAGKFTFEYATLSGLTENKEEVKQQVNSIKTLVEKFSGTYIGEALTGGVNQFPEKKESSRRFLVLLTDGQDTSNKQGYDKEKLGKAIELAKGRQVQVITIGLGEEVDRESLENIAKETGGKAYYTSNADGLQNIFEVISSQMNYGMTDIDKDSINDNIVIQDSKFFVRKNGFHFDNFASKKEAAGATYGMALASKMIYEGTFPNSLADMSIKLPNSGEIGKASGYNISLNTTELYDFELGSLTFLNEDSKKMRGSVVDGNVPFTQEVSEQLKSFGFDSYKTQVKDASASGFKTYENYSVDFASENFVENVKGSDKEVLNAIYRMDILKYRDETISFTSNPQKAMEMIQNEIKSGKPVLLKLNDIYTVLATKVILDDINPNKIKLEVYDPNEQGMTKYVEIDRVKLEKQNEQEIAVGGSYIYKFKYNGSDVTAGVSIPNVEVNL